MIKSVTWVGVLLVIIALAKGQLANKLGRPSLLVIPSRQTVVQFAMDVTSIRSIYLIAYERNQIGDQELYIWDVNNDEWVNIDPEAFHTGELLSISPRVTFLISQEGQAFEGIMSEYNNVIKIQSLNITELVNALHKELRFQPSEWKWFADRYGFGLEDKNADRRRYGRYGRPGDRLENPSEEFRRPVLTVDSSLDLSHTGEGFNVLELELESVVKEKVVELDDDKNVRDIVLQEKGAPVPQEKMLDEVGLEIETVIQKKEESFAGEKIIGDAVLQEKGFPDLK